MKCQKCKGNISVKQTEKYITLMCNCEIMIIYNNKTTSQIPKQEYQKGYKNELNKKRY